MLSNNFCSNHVWVSYIGFTEAYNDATETAAVNPMSKDNQWRIQGQSK